MTIPRTADQSKRTGTFANVPLSCFLVSLVLQPPKKQTCKSEREPEGKNTAHAYRIPRKATDRETERGTGRRKRAKSSAHPLPTPPLSIIACPLRPQTICGKTCQTMLGEDGAAEEFFKGGRPPIQLFCVDLICGRGGPVSLPGPMRAVTILSGPDALPMLFPIFCLDPHIGGRYMQLLQPRYPVYLLSLSLPIPPNPPSPIFLARPRSNP